MARGSRAGAEAGAGAAHACKYPDKAKVAAHSNRSVGDASIGMVAGVDPLTAGLIREALVTTKKSPGNEIAKSYSCLKPHGRRDAWDDEHSFGFGAVFSAQM